MSQGAPIDSNELVSLSSNIVSGALIGYQREVRPRQETGVNKIGRRAAWILLGLSLIASSVPTHAAVSTSTVKIPLDQADIRFGKFYVKSLDSILYRPTSKEPVPTVIFLHGCGGTGGWQGEKNAREYGLHFAAQGYAFLLLDTLDARKLKQTPCSDRNISFSLLDARRGDIDAAVQWLVANKIAMPDKIVALGSSHGGQVVIEHDQKSGGSALLAGAIAFYAGCDRGAPFARYPLLILVGDKDFTDGPRRSLGEICSDYVKAANLAGGASAEVVVYPGAGHNFDTEGVKPQVSQSLNASVSAYQAAASKASREKIDAFLAQVFH